MIHALAQWSVGYVGLSTTGPFRCPAIQRFRPVKSEFYRFRRRMRWPAVTLDIGQLHDCKCIGLGFAQTRQAGG